jgi:hypothetical protein
MFVVTAAKCVFAIVYMNVSNLFITNYTHDLAVGGLWSKLKYLGTAR